MAQFGFSWLGLGFLAMVTIPNLFWTRCQPEGYDPGGENRMLLVCERVGQVCVTAFVLLHRPPALVRSLRLLWLAAALTAMLLYEFWWLRYFRSMRQMADFYGSYAGVPVAGATLPVLGFLLLGIYIRAPLLIAAVLLLGIGHIGIHLEYLKNL